MKVVVLDDDPTGTQSASDVRVLLRWTAAEIAEALKNDSAVYLQTNSRALTANEARSQVADIRSQMVDAERLVGAPMMSVLRGDSTLRGHVFPESDEFAITESLPILFVPAFPEAGRVTIRGVHYVGTCGNMTPVAETEYAHDPVFGFRSSNLVDWVREKGNRHARHVPLNILRSTNGNALREQVLSAGAGQVIVPDVETDGDIDLIAKTVKKMWKSGQRVVVRSGAPLAAALAGKRSPSGCPALVGASDAPVLIVCGSHTEGASAQLRYLQKEEHVKAVVVNTDAAIKDADSEGVRAGTLVKRHLSQGVATILSSERTRRADHNTLEYGSLVMSALTRAVAICKGTTTAFVTKGGITSAEVIRSGLGADSAWVRGQVETGVSLWELENPAAEIVVVPGNIGTRETLANVVRLFRTDS